MLHKWSAYFNCMLKYIQISKNMFIKYSLDVDITSLKIDA